MVAVTSLFGPSYKAPESSASSDSNTQTSSDTSAETSTGTTAEPTTTETQSQPTSSSAPAATSEAAATNGAAASGSVTDRQTQIPAQLSAAEVERQAAAQARDAAIDARDSMVRGMMLTRITEAAEASAPVSLTPIQPTATPDRIATLYAPMANAFDGDQSNSGAQPLDMSA